MTSKKKPDAERHAQLMRGVAAYAEEKAQADEVVAAERAAGVPAGTVNFSVRLPADIAVQMRAAASQQHLPTSVWLRRLITTALQAPPAEAVTDQRIEEIVRRVLGKLRLA